MIPLLQRQGGGALTVAELDLGVQPADGAVARGLCGARALRRTTATLAEQAAAVRRASKAELKAEITRRAARGADKKGGALGAFLSGRSGWGAE